MQNVQIIVLVYLFQSFFDAVIGYFFKFHHGGKVPAFFVYVVDINVFVVPKKAATKGLEGE